MACYTGWCNQTGARSWIKFKQSREANRVDPYCVMCQIKAGFKCKNYAIANGLPSLDEL